MAAATTGMTMHETSVRRRSMKAMKPRIAASVARSMKTETTPSVKNSLRASTSLVVRVIVRPMGVRSK